MASVPPIIRRMQAELDDGVLEAYLLAAKVHERHRRRSGEPYITHPVAVAEMLFGVGADRDVVLAALLHDAVEDSDDARALENEIYERFGDHVLYLVDAVSKDGRITDKTAQQHAYFEQIRQAFEVDIFVFFIKVADLIHNMSTITSLSPERKAAWIRELQYEYLPLFSEFYHRIPLHYRSMYHQLLDVIQAVIDAHDAQKTARDR